LVTIVVGPCAPGVDKLRCGDREEPVTGHDFQDRRIALRVRAL
jgi:hypothetical protein